VGKASQMDALKARIAAAKLSEERFDRQRTLQKARASINSLVNRPPDSPIVMALPDLTPPMSPVTFDTLSRTALERRPELLEIQRGSVVSANASLALAKTVYEPDFEFRIEARQFNGHSGIQEYDTGVFLNFPWLNAARNRAVIAEARAQVERNAAEYETVRVQTMEAIQQSYDGIQTMHHHYELFASSILPLQRAAVEAARAGYETNETTLADLIEAQRMLLDAEMQQLHHIGEFHRLRAELERLVGGDLPTKESQK
jgi:outer membrane protein TolC